jgi:pilus assembly protein CpaF
MRHVITISGSAKGSGKTTLSAGLAGILRAGYGLRTALVESSDKGFDTAKYLGLRKGHEYVAGADFEKYMDEGSGLLVIHDSGKNAVEIAKNLKGHADAVIIDDSMERFGELAAVSDAVIFPARLEPEDVNRAIRAAEKLSAMNYPASLFGAIINKASDSLLSKEDVTEVFGKISLCGYIPFYPGMQAETSGGRLLAVMEKNGLRALLAEAAKKIIQKNTGQQKNNFAGQEPGRLPKKESASRELRIRIYSRLFEKLDIKTIEKDSPAHPEKRGELFEKVKKAVGELLDAEKTATGRPQREEITKEIFDEVAGLGAIEGLLGDPEVSEIMVNGSRDIYYEKKGKIARYEKAFTGDAAVMRAIERIVLPLGRRVDESMPYVDARLPDGSRVNAIIPPLAIDGPVLTIRRFPSKKLDVSDLISFKSLTPEMAKYLEEAVSSRKNILISGGTGSGKTTLLNVLSSFIPQDERIVTVEDSAELRLTQEHVVRLEARPPNIEGRGEVTIRDLVKNTLRMRPDRIVVGECRGGEALDMLQAMNTGHEGSMTTVHANTPRDALSRIEIMVFMAGVDLPLRALREQIRSAIDVVVQQSRLKDGSRKVTHIAEITGMEGDKILMHNVFENF